MLADNVQQGRSVSGFRAPNSLSSGFCPLSPRFGILRISVSYRSTRMRQNISLSRFYRTSLSEKRIFGAIFAPGTGKVKRPKGRWSQKKLARDRQCCRKRPQEAHVRPRAPTGGCEGNPPLGARRPARPCPGEMAVRQCRATVNGAPCRTPALDMLGSQSDGTSGRPDIRDFCSDGVFLGNRGSARGTLRPKGESPCLTCADPTHSHHAPFPLHSPMLR